MGRALPAKWPDRSGKEAPADRCLTNVHFITVHTWDAVTLAVRSGTLTTGPPDADARRSGVAGHTLMPIVCGSDHLWWAALGAYLCY